MNGFDLLDDLARDYFDMYVSRYVFVCLVVWKIN